MFSVKYYQVDSDKLIFFLVFGIGESESPPSKYGMHEGTRRKNKQKYIGIHRNTKERRVRGGTAL